MRPLPQKVVDGLKTKSDKIRALSKAGFARTEIAQFLQIRYQHVRSVLVADGTSAKPSSARPARTATSADSPPLFEDWAIERLLEAGFELVGECRSLRVDAFEFTDKAPQKPGVYVFAVDGIIMYVGLTRSSLRNRLGHYVYGHEQQKTSARVKGLILSALAAGHKVSVLVAAPPQLEWKGLPIDGAAGLETGLIGLIQPRWNQHGSRRGRGAADQFPPTAQ